MAARGTSLGLRRGGPRLKRLAWLVALLLPACFGLSEDEENRLDVHRRNSQEFYQMGQYTKALHQAEAALLLDEEDPNMRLMKGWCLVKLGQARAETRQLDKAIEVYESLIDDHAGDGDFRVWLGAGRAYLARAMDREQEIGRIQRRLGSDFLDTEGRRAEEADLAAEEQARDEALGRAERALRRVFTFPLHRDNLYAHIDLVLVLNQLGGRETEALEAARRAVELLVEATEQAEETLRKELRLDPRQRLDVERRIEENLARERQLRDIVITIEFNRKAYQACRQEFAALDDRQLMDATLHFSRAGIHELLGMDTEAIDDLETFLSLRAREVEYDETAAAVYDRIDMLRARSATSARR